MSLYDQSISKKFKRFDTINNPSTALPQINKTMQMRPTSPMRSNTFWAIKEESKKSEGEDSDYYITPFSPKLKPRNIGAELGGNILRRITEDKQDIKDNLDIPFRRSIRIRSLNEWQKRKRLFSHDAPRRSGLDTDDNTPPKANEKKLYIQIKNKGSHDKVFSWNSPNFQPKCATVESKKVDMKKVSKLAQLLKFHS